MKKLFLTFCALLFSAALWAGVAPTPEMDFSFIYNTAQKPAILADYSDQFQCADSLCSEPRPLGRYGLQKLYCTKASCFSIAYDYNRHQKLSIGFADGVQRQSNVFISPGMLRSSYNVYVNDNGLQVEQIKTPLTTVNVVLRTDAWVSLIIILLLESLAAFAYLRYTNKKYSIIYSVVIVNFLTLPISWMFLSRYINETSFLWLFCFVFEALFIWAFNRRKIHFYDSLMLSLATNVTSYSVGMMLSFWLAPLIF